MNIVLVIYIYKAAGKLSLSVTFVFVSTHMSPTGECSSPAYGCSSPHTGGCSSPTEGCSSPQTGGCLSPTGGGEGGKGGKGGCHHPFPSHSEQSR